MEIAGQDCMEINSQKPALMAEERSFHLPWALLIGICRNIAVIHGEVILLEHGSGLKLPSIREGLCPTEAPLHLTVSDAGAHEVYAVAQRPPVVHRVI